MDTQAWIGVVIIVVVVALLSLAWRRGQSATKLPAGSRVEGTTTAARRGRRIAKGLKVASQPTPQHDLQTHFAIEDVALEGLTPQPPRDLMEELGHGLDQLGVNLDPPQTQGQQKESKQEPEPKAQPAAPAPRSVGKLPSRIDHCECGSALWHREELPSEEKGCEHLFYIVTVCSECGKIYERPKLRQRLPRL